MRTRNWMATTLSVSLGLGMLGGCGSSPAPTAPSQKAATAPTINAPAMATSAEVKPAPATTNVEAPVPPIAAQQAAPSTPTTPATGAVGAGEQPAAPAAPVAGAEVPAAGGAVVPSGPLATTPIGGIGPTVAGGILPPPITGPFAYEGAMGLVTFQSDRATGGGKGWDIFVFDANAATVLALPGVNTWADETNARMSSNGEWLIYQTNENGNNDIYLFSLRTQLINTLNTLNTPDDEEMPDVSDDGTMIVYVKGPDHKRFSRGKDEGYHDKWNGWRFKRDEEIMLFDILTGANYKAPVANRGLWDVNWPTISGNGEVIAYGASDGFSSDVFVYSLATAAQLTPPFINTAAGEYNPDLNAAGDVILFVSDRRGSEDIYAVDMRSGFTDNLVLANTKWCEQEPRWLGGAPDAVVFHSDRTGEFRLFAYSLTTAVLNTLPVAHEVGTNATLRDVTPALEDGGCVDCLDDKDHHDGGKK